MSAFLSAAAEFLSLGQIQIEEDLGSQTFTWHGKEVLCVPTGFEGGLNVGVGPKGEELTGRLFVRRSNFLTADSTLITVDSDLFTADNDTPTPVAGKSLIFRGKTRRIVTAKEDGARSGYVLELEAFNKATK